MCLTTDTWYSVSASVSWAGFVLLLSTGPYDANSGTSASCCTYADCVSAAVGGGGVTIFDVLGAWSASSVLGPTAKCQKNVYTDAELHSRAASFAA